MQGDLSVTGNAEADQLLNTDPLALLLGMLLDQQVPMEWAFTGPSTLRRRLGHLDPSLIGYQLARGELKPIKPVDGRIAPAETAPHPETHQMDIVVHVKPGRRARVGIIQLKNGTEYRDAEILSRLKLKAGGEITSAKLQRGTGRIRKYLVKKGHLSGLAAVRRGNYDAAKNTMR